MMLNEREAWEKVASNIKHEIGTKYICQNIKHLYYRDFIDISVKDVMVAKTEAKASELYHMGKTYFEDSFALKEGSEREFRITWCMDRAKELEA